MSKIYTEEYKRIIVELYNSGQILAKLNSEYRLPKSTILDLLHRKLEDSFYRLKTYLFKNYPDRFYVYAKSNMESNSSEAIQYIIRYTGSVLYS